jgi:hypothetical protein
MTCINICAFCTSHLQILYISNNLQSSCRGVSSTVLFGDGGNTAPYFFLQCGISPYLPQQILAGHLIFPT